MENKEEIRQAVREGYAEVARQSNSCCSPAKSIPQAAAAQIRSHRRAWPNESATATRS
jgi:hypothetical protein